MMDQECELGADLLRSRNVSLDIAAALAAIAHARPGAVLIHCGGGRDRTGLLTMILLALVGVDPDDIASDYELSYERMRALYAAPGEPDQGPILQRFFAEENSSARAVILDILESVDIEHTLRAGGMTQADLTAVRERLRGSEEGDPFVLVARPPAPA